MLQSKLYVIIVTYNGMKWINECLNSCLNYNVIVVDNKSTDESVSFISANYPKVIILPQDKNLGFGQGNNLGISYALNLDADYVFLLNQDAYLSSNCIENLVAMHKKKPEYGLISPLHLNGRSTAIDFNFSNYLKRYNVAEKILFEKLNSIEQDVYDIPFVNAAAWLLPSETLETVGGFDPLFFHYGEDRNYCQRILYHNIKICVMPHLAVKHDREFRENNSIEPFTETFYNHYERDIKVSFGDINNENYKVLFKTKLKKLNKLLFISILKFDYKGIKDAIRKRNILKDLDILLVKSRDTNKSVGMHYISKK